MFAATETASKIPKPLQGSAPNGLEAEMQQLRRERSQVMQLRQQLHLGTQQLDQERAAFARSQVR